MEDNNLHHYLVYLEPPQKISNEIEKLNRKIDALFPNTYQSYMNKRWFSHIAVFFPSPVPQSNADKIIKTAEKISEDYEPIKLTFSGYKLGKDGWIFLSFTSTVINNRMRAFHTKFISISYISDRD